MPPGIGGPVKLIKEFDRPPFSACEDASLPRNGIEIQSPACTYGAIMNTEILEPIWELYDKGCYVTDRCGGHIHVSATPLRTNLIESIFRFVLENDALRIFLSGRPRSARYGTKRQQYSYPTRKELEQKSGYRMGGPITFNYRTIEFRMFRGPSGREEFYKNLQFIRALLECSDCFTRRAPTENEFLEFCCDFSNEYEHLWKWISWYLGLETPEEPYASVLNYPEVAEHVHHLRDTW